MGLQLSCLTFMYSLPLSRSVFSQPFRWNLPCCLLSTKQPEASHLIVIKLYLIKWTNSHNQNAFLYNHATIVAKSNERKKKKLIMYCWCFKCCTQWCVVQRALVFEGMLLCWTIRGANQGFSSELYRNSAILFLIVRVLFCEERGCWCYMALRSKTHESSKLDRKFSFSKN